MRAKNNSPYPAEEYERDSEELDALEESLDEMNSHIQYMQSRYVEWMDIWFSLHDQRYPALSRVEAIVRSELREELDRRGFSDYAHDRAVRVVTEIDRIYREEAAEQGKRNNPRALDPAKQMVEQQKAAIGQGQSSRESKSV